MGALAGSDPAASQRPGSQCSRGDLFTAARPECESRRADDPGISRSRSGRPAALAHRCCFSGLRRRVGGRGGRVIVPLSKGGSHVCSEAVRRCRPSAVTGDIAGYHSARSPQNKGQRYPADPPTIDEIVAVMR